MEDENPKNDKEIAQTMALITVIRTLGSVGTL